MKAFKLTVTDCLSVSGMGIDEESRSPDSEILGFMTPPVVPVLKEKEEQTGERAVRQD